MARCLELARLGIGHTAPNPMVGAVLVHGDRIIGEGYHQVYGGPHAEVNCINSVSPENISLISSSTLFVSLEPCAHFGKTPPCADLIIEKKIPRVIVACRDPFESVNGKGIEKLEKAGIDVTVGVLEKEAIELNKRFFTLHRKNRPYIILKWAQTADHKIASLGRERLIISNEFTNRKTHQWRTEEAAILVGTNTALKDDPQLNNRLWPGKAPVKLLIDLSLKVPSSAKLFSGGNTIVYNSTKSGKEGNIEWYRIDPNSSLPEQVIGHLKSQHLLSVLVEGGARLLQSFINENLWDEARVITNTSLSIGPGLHAPEFLRAQKVQKTDQIQSDLIQIFYQQDLIHH